MKQLKPLTITGILPFGAELSAITVSTLVFSPNATASVEQGAILHINNQQAIITVASQDGTAQLYTHCPLFEYTATYDNHLYTKTDTLGQVHYKAARPYWLTTK